MLSRPTALLLLAFTLTPAVAVAEVKSLPLTRASLVFDSKVGPNLLNTRWRFHAGDDPSWRQPDLDDSAWETVNPELLPGASPRGGWTGDGWFRLHLDVEPQLRGEVLALNVMARGALEIYLNGKRVFAGGDLAAARAGADPQIIFAVSPPLRIRLSGQRRQVLTVRFASQRVAACNRMGGWGGARISLTALRDEGHFSRFARLIRGSNNLFIGATLALALLHLLLFIFYRDKRENLYYALATSLIALISISSLWFFKETSVDTLAVAVCVFGAAVTMGSVMLTLFYYTVFYPRLPRRFWVLLAVGLGISLATYWLPRGVIYGFAALLALEQFRVMVVALVKRADGAWIIGLGGLGWILGAALQMLGDLLIIEPVPFAYLVGFGVLLGSMSIYLARAIARDKVALAEQVVQIQALSEATLEQERHAQQEEMARKVLEAANTRKAIKLKEAAKRELVLQRLEVAHKELRETQAQLVQSEKMAAMGQLVAGVAHEVNTPLGAIHSTSDSLARALRKLEAALDEACPGARLDNRKLTVALKAIGQASEVIGEGSERVTEIITRLRSFARLDEAEHKRIDIRQGIEDALVLLQHQIPAEIAVTRELGEVPQVHCNPRQLNQVFLNLLLNARQAIEGEGEIFVSTALREEQVVIVIRDSGAGIPVENMAKIFDPGFTTRGVGVGAGLGLAIAYSAIKDHEGEITVESEPGQGTTVTIMLPVQVAGR
jgi:signal transduction histidine kinase